jgi:hypothetical protein
VTEKKKDGSYEITVEPEMIFFDNARYIFYYQLLYKYPENVFYLRLIPENGKTVFNPEKFSISYENNVIELQVLEIKKTDTKKKDVQKIMICDYATFNILKNEQYSIILKTSGLLNNEEKEIEAVMENYDKVYFRQISDYIDNFKLKLKKEEEKNKK